MSEHQIVHPINISEIEARLGSHSIFAPSSSSMWAYCSGSLIPNVLAKDSAGIDAAEGTVAHGVGEEWLRSGIRPDHLVGNVVKMSEGENEFEIEITTEMLEYLEEYVNRCMLLPGSHHIETRVDFSDLTPIKKQSGTADHAACEYQKLTITDLKYGKNVQVFAKDNTQLILYAYGFFRAWDWLYDFQEITMRIVQPRQSHYDEWTITREELLRWAAWLKERAYAAWCSTAVRTPGVKQCRFCRIQTDCAAYVVFMERLTEGVFENLDAPITTEEMQSTIKRIEAGEFELSPYPIGELTVEHKVKLLPFRPLFEKFFSSLIEDLETRALHGEVIPGYKLVRGKSSREFLPCAKERLIDDLGVPEERLYTRPQMISPAQAEALLIEFGYKRKMLPTLLSPAVVKTTPGKPTLVAEHDKREALPSAAGVFDNLDDL